MTPLRATTLLTAIVEEKGGHRKITVCVFALPTKNILEE